MDSILLPTRFHEVSSRSLNIHDIENMFQIKVYYLNESCTLSYVQTLRKLYRSGVDR
jgi:hypothetical protein